MNTVTCYKWHVNIVLKGSGVIKRCIYEGIESNAQDVFFTLFTFVRPPDVITLCGENESTTTCIVVSEIASIDIYQKGRTTSNTEQTATPDALYNVWSGW